MNKIEFIFDMGIVLLSLVATISCLLIIMKTEKELKKVFEYLFVSFVVLFLASILGMNKYFNLISAGQIKWVIIMSRFIALLCSTKATITMLGIVRKQIQCDFNQPADVMKKQK